MCIMLGAALDDSYVRDMTHQYVWHASFIRVTCLTHTYDMTHSYMWHNSFVRVTCLIYMCEYRALANISCLGARWMIHWVTIFSPQFFFLCGFFLPSFDRWMISWEWRENTHRGNSGRFIFGWVFFPWFIREFFSAQEKKWWTFFPFSGLIVEGYLQSACTVCIHFWIYIYTCTCVCV